MKNTGIYICITVKLFCPVEKNWKTSRCDTLKHNMWNMFSDQGAFWHKQVYLLHSKFFVIYHHHSVNTEPLAFSRGVLSSWDSMLLQYNRWCLHASQMNKSYFWRHVFHTLWQIITFLIFRMFYSQEMMQHFMFQMIYT